jgi:glycosyltransferase involved in cell wall biosynthesis
MSRVDVITPCYKYAHFLRRCVRSALDQEGVEVRVLILDDASPDNTPEVAAELMKEDGRVQYRRHVINHGHIATYNEGLDWASGDYLLLLGADDLLTPGALGRAVRLLDAHPEVGLACGQQIIFHVEEDLLVAGPPPEQSASRVLSGGEFLEWLCSSGSNPIASPTPVARTALQHKIGGYRRELPHTADLELWLRFAVHGSIGMLDVPQAFKRSHGQNMQLQYAHLGDFQQRKAAFDVLFREYGGRIADRDRLQRRAYQALATEAFWAASGVFDDGQSRLCRELLEFAVGTDPTLPSRPEWSRLRWKQRLGPRAWGLLRPIVERLRGQSGPRTAPS